MPFQKIIPILVISFVLTGCFEAGKKKAKTVRGKAYVGALSSSSSSMNNYVSALSTPSKWGEAEESNGSYASAKIDGIKVKLLSVWGSSEGEDQQFSSLDKTLELTQNTTSIALEEIIEAPVGNYNQAGLKFENKVEIKAFCRTKDKCLYTTTYGVKEVTSCAPGDDLPLDYDYLKYDFLYVTMKDNTLSDGYQRNFTITENSTPNLFLLIDTYKIVSCWDGEDRETPGRGAPPISWWLDDTAAIDHPLRYKNVPDQVPGAFGVSYIPMIVYLSDDPQDIPYAKSYLTTAQENGVPELENSLLTTFALNQNEEIIALRSRNIFDGGATGTGLEQGWAIGSNDGTSYILYNGEHNPLTRTWRKTRMIENFSLFDGDKTVTVENGPDCLIGYDAESIHRCFGHYQTDEDPDDDFRLTTWKQVDRDN